MNPNPNYGLLLASRRFFVLSALGIAMGLAARRVGAARGEDAPLRPPGASPETLFAGLCLRCGNCIRSCPEKIIYSDLGQAGVAGLLAPVVRYEKKYCREGCTVCTELCPSGALQPLNVKEKQRYIIGEALLDIELCVLALGQRDCDACARACPYDAVHIFWDEDQYIAYPVVDFKKCNGCGACEVACPVSGYKAIRVWRKA
jgi:ferredoxin-type protein NapF